MSAWSVWPHKNSGYQHPFVGSAFFTSLLGTLPACDMWTLFAPISHFHIHCVVACEVPTPRFLTCKMQTLQRLCLSPTHFLTRSMQIVCGHFLTSCSGLLHAGCLWTPLFSTLTSWHAPFRLSVNFSGPICPHTPSCTFPEPTIFTVCVIKEVSPQRKICVGCPREPSACSP